MVEPSWPPEALAEAYASWWIDLLGEHNHIGGSEATHWLLDRSGLRAGELMLDCGAFVGAAAREAATRLGVRAVAVDLNTDFLTAGRAMAGGAVVSWLAGAAQKLPFRDGTFASVWSLDSAMPPRELSRVAAPAASLCLCCEVPTDNRGGVESFLDEWREYGWGLAAHRPLSLDATQTWRRMEADLVRRRPHFEARYGQRGYLGQLDMVAGLVAAYERGEQGHGLFVFRRSG